MLAENWFSTEAVLILVKTKQVSFKITFQEKEYNQGVEGPDFQVTACCPGLIHFLLVHFMSITFEL